MLVQLLNRVRQNRHKGMGKMRAKVETRPRTGLHRGEPTDDSTLALPNADLQSMLPGNASSRIPSASLAEELQALNHVTMVSFRALVHSPANTHLIRLHESRQ